MRSLSVRSLIRGLAGNPPDLSSRRDANLFWGHFARHLFTLIHRSYLARSRGGSDDQGQVWEPLKPRTISRKLRLARRHRRRGAGRLRDLIPDLDDRWKAIFASHVSRLAPVMGLQAARLEAAKIAWGVLRREGYQEQTSPTAGMAVPIMIDSGRLIRSFSPGRVTTRYHPRRDQVFEINGSRITIGSDVPYAEYAARRRPILTGAVIFWARQAIAVAAARSGVGRAA